MGENIEEVAAYRSFVEFYPFYLSQHAKRTSRRLHFASTLNPAWLGTFR
jgi:hypothetical protein